MNKKKIVVLLMSMVFAVVFLWTTNTLAEPKASHPANIVVGNWSYCTAGLFCTTPAGQVTWVANNAGTIYTAKHGAGTFSGSWSGWVFTGTASFPSSPKTAFGKKVTMNFNYNAAKQVNMFTLKIYYTGSNGTTAHYLMGYGKKM